MSECTQGGTLVQGCKNEVNMEKNVQSNAGKQYQCAFSVQCIPQATVLETVCMATQASLYTLITMYYNVFMLCYIG